MPPLPEIDSETLTDTSAQVIAPSDVPDGLVLTLQVLALGASEWSDYASGITAGGRVTVSLTTCQWHALRWVTALPAPEEPEE